jgi:hypothetical protein
VLNVPTEQSGHCRSAMAEPGEAGEMKWPALQSLQGAHALAELMSWSHEPSPQAPPGFVPPGQYQPIGQGAHVAGVVVVAGAV